jgi:HTH-type transcriptional regulator/antitoxin HigA
MTLTFDSQKYANLLSKYQPKLIRTEEENRQALEVLQELLRNPTSTPEETELYRLLIALIEKFEEEYYAPNPEPPDMLLFLMDQRNMTATDLTIALDSPEVVADILNGKQAISSAQAIALGRFFNVDPSIFT